MTISPKYNLNYVIYFLIYSNFSDLKLCGIKKGILLKIFDSTQTEKLKPKIWIINVLILKAAATNNN